MIYKKDNKFITPNSGVIRIENKTIYNPTEEQILAAGYFEYIPVITLEQVRETKLDDLITYDKSSSVNEFMFGDNGYWIPLELRTSLLTMSIPACEAANQENIYLSHEGLSLTLPIETAKQMLLQLEFYAKQCWDNTASHRQAINALTTKEEIEAYDFTTGYPEKLTFNI